MQHESGASEDMVRRRNALLSRGHSPPRFVDEEIPTLEKSIFAEGGPSKVSPGAQGSNPWILGSATIGTNHFWNLLEAKFAAGSPNVWFKLRHNHSGSSNPRGGTMDAWHLASRGETSAVGDHKTPLRSIPAGTVFLYGFGAGSVSGTTSNRVHRTLGTRAVDRFSGLLRGWVE